MSAHPDGWIPAVPDALETEEFIPVVILDGQEHGRREQVDICSSYEKACELGEVFVRNVGMGARYVVLRREVGQWEEIER